MISLYNMGMENVYQAALGEMQEGRKHVVVTVIESRGHSPAKVGIKMLVRIDGSIAGTIGGGALEKLCIERALDLLNTGISKVQQFWLDDSAPPAETEPAGMVCGGRVTLFFEFCGAKEELFIFGAGHIGRAIAYHTAPLGFRTTVYDDRPSILKDFPALPGVKTGNLNLDEFPSAVPETAWAVVASYSHDMDYKILRALLGSAVIPRYIGVVASRKKRRTFFEQLEKELPEKPDYSRIYTPCGLNIGTREPHDIAIAITAEILALLNSGGKIEHLRDR